MKNNALLGFPTLNLPLLLRRDAADLSEVRVTGSTDGNDTDYTIKTTRVPQKGLMGWWSGRIEKEVVEIQGKYAGEPVDIVGESKGRISGSSVVVDDSTGDCRDHFINGSMTFKSRSGIPVEETIESGGDNCQLKVTSRIDGTQAEGTVQFYPIRNNLVYRATWNIAGTEFSTQFDPTDDPYEELVDGVQHFKLTSDMDGDVKNGWAGFDWKPWPSNSSAIQVSVQDVPKAGRSNGRTNSCLSFSGSYGDVPTREDATF